MTDTLSIKVNAAAVIGEIIDDEAVIMNLESGCYYTMDGVGAAIWHLIEGGASLDTVVAVIAHRYDGDQTAIRQAVSGLIDELKREKLILTEPTSAAKSPARLPEDDGVGGAFEPPVLHKFTDMQDLLLVDPIHEIDEEKGWPYIKIDPSE